MIKDYIIQERLGIGAYGIVYKVLKKTNNNPYVIKQVPLFGLSQEQISDVKLEAKILSSVKSIYIVRYFDSFEENNYLNIVMEYCNGGDLCQFIEKNKKTNKLLKEDLIWSIFLKITIGLATLHKSKILHRDLKALNIFLTKELDIKIGDFGVAKILTQTGFAKTIIGTPYYLSPELCDEQPYNDKSDVWALGCILYELCTYNHPFNAKCQASLILKILQNNPDPISKDYSENLQKLILIILDKNHLTRPSCYDILNNPFVVEKAKNIGLYEKIKCLYPDLVLTKKIIKNNCFKSCANFPEINNKCDINNDDKRILKTEEIGKKCNYSKVVVKKYINLNIVNNRNKSKSKENKNKNKKINLIYFESKTKNDSKKKSDKNENDRLNFKKIKERIEKLESRSKSYDRNKNKNKINKDKFRLNNISHSKNKSIDKSANKSKSTNRKNRINKSIEEFEKNIRKKKKRKGALVLHKSKTPLKFNSNYLSLNDDDIFNNLNTNDIVNNKKIDKIIQKELSDKKEIKILINMTDFAKYLNSYSTQYKQTEINNNSNKIIGKSFSKEKIKINSDCKRLKNIKRNNKSISKSKSRSKSKNKSKEKIKEKEIYNPINYSVDINQNPKYYNKIYISSNNVLKSNPTFNNASINIYNNINNIHINNINNIKMEINNSKEKPKIINNKYIIYNQKKNLLNYNMKKNNNNNYRKLHKSKSNEKKRENNLFNDENKKKKKDNNGIINNQKVKYNNNLNNYSEMKKMRTIIKNDMLKLIGDKDYKYIMDLYEKTYINKDQNKIREYFESIEKYVKSNFNSQIKEKIDDYMNELISIDCVLNIY